jgi:hypothetical protein
MEHISILIKDILLSKRPKSKRAVLIKEIATKLKNDREPFYYKGNKKVKLKPLTDKLIAIRVGHYSEELLEALIESCKHSKNYSKTFWYLTKKF